MPPVWLNGKYIHVINRYSHQTTNTTNSETVKSQAVRDAGAVVGRGGRHFRTWRAPIV